MITLEQVHLLEEKVESAVLKIAALTAENADLRRSHGELAAQNSELSRKNTELSEMLSLYEEDQGRIEKGILNALNRLNDVENSVLKVAAAAHTPPAAGEEIERQPENPLPPPVPPVSAPQQDKPAENRTDNGQIDIF